MLVPIALIVAVLGFKQSATEGTLFGLASSLGFTFLLAQLVRDRGKAKEPWLFEKWNGKPTMAMLRHCDSRLNVHTRARYHTRLSSMLRIKLPTSEQEKTKPADADAAYSTCGDYLLSRTRDKERFQLLFQENVNYGFRRNLWAMKPVGVTICVLSLVALAFITRHGSRSRNDPVVCESVRDCDCSPAAHVVGGSDHAELGEDRSGCLCPATPRQH